MRYIFFLPALVFMIMANVSCHKSGQLRGKYTGKLAVAGVCGQFIIQLLSGPIDSDSSLLTKSWHNLANDSTYTNVFGSGNSCGIVSAGIKQGDSFSFDLGADETEGGCVACMLYYPMPPTHSAIKNVQKL